LGEFGDKFRKARETKSITLDDVSNVTKISARMLQAIEEEKFDQLPGGVFNKGFIRAYARHLGINDEEAVTEYLACLRRAQVEAQAVWEPPARVVTQVKRPAAAPVAQTVKVPSPAHLDELPGLQLPRAEHVLRPRQKFLDTRDRAPNWRLLAVALLVILLLVVLRRRNSGGVDAGVSPTASVTQSSTGAPNTAAASSAGASRPVSSAVSPASTPINPSSGQISSGHASSSNVSSGDASPGNASAQKTQPASAKPVASTPPKPAADGAENDVTTRSFGAVSAPETAKAAAPLLLVIRATENSWISVSADGKTTSQETLIAPAATSVRANREIVAKVGNAAGVTFLWNGQEIQAQGTESEVKTFVFDANGMRVLPGQSTQQNQ
jgi:cytoskeletal protein RodZ